MAATPRPSSPGPLIAEYSRTFRMIEIASIALFAMLFAVLAARGLVAPRSLSAGQIVVIVLLGILSADFLSGLVHWAADTWGDQTWPIVGPTLIRSFREHHVDESAITHHDFIEANGANALVLLPFMVVVHAVLPIAPAAWTPIHAKAALFALSLTLFVLMTNQVHKWAHQDRPPLVARLLQRLGLVLSAAHHRQHHRAPHTTHYCITTGWLNPLLDRVRFFRMSETLIQTLSTLRPREDDLKLIQFAAAEKDLDT